MLLMVSFSSSSTKTFTLLYVVIKYHVKVFYHRKIRKVRFTVWVRNISLRNPSASTMTEYTRITRDPDRLAACLYCMLACLYPRRDKQIGCSRGLVKIRVAGIGNFSKRSAEHASELNYLNRCLFVRDSLLVESCMKIALCDRIRQVWHLRKQNINY